jgi:hypothetical protein
MLLVATLAPLWDYGLEVRHDNVLLTALLLAWSAARPLQERAKRSLFCVGFIAAVAQFIAYKAFAYLLPVALFALVAAWIEDRPSLFRAPVALAAGAAAGTGLSVGIHLLEGTWWLYMSSFAALAKSAAEVERTSPAFTLMRALQEAPLLVLAGAAAVMAGAVQLVRRRGFSRDSVVPECALLAAASAALLVNPTPYPYNLVLVVPQVAILVLRFFPRSIELWTRGGVWKPALACLIVAHFLTWMYPTLRHLQMPNGRQFLLMTTAEAMTDPKVHAVFDGSGLVPTRRPPGFHWLLHGFSIPFFRNGTFGRIHEQLAEGRTPVIIPSYRTGWLPTEDRRFISEHYMPLAGDFWVAGKLLVEPGTVRWECIVPGRYFVVADPPESAVRIDGQPAAAGPVTFSRGEHTIDSAAQRMVVAWVGPYMKAPPALGHGTPQQVFVNWY